MSSFQNKKFWPGFFVGGIGSLVLFGPLFVKGAADHLWANDLDPLLIQWITAWGYHALFELRDPGIFWQANAFYPETYALAFSDSLLSAQLFYAPLRFLGCAPFTSLYLTLVGFTILGCILTSFALDKIDSFRPVEKIIIIVSTHFSLCFSNFLYHYQLFGFHLAPAYLLFLYSFLRNGELRDLLSSCLIFSLAVCFSTYLAPFLAALTIIVGTPFLAYTYFRRNIKVFTKKNVIPSLLVIMFFSILLYGLQFYPYLLIENKFGAHSLADKIVYSASPYSLFSEYSENSFWYKKWTSYATGDWEHAYFPGFILIGAGFSFFVYLFFLSITKGFRNLFGKKSFSPKYNLRFPFNASIVIFFLLLFVTCLVLSWGPFLKENPTISLPYYYLSSFLPGLISVRAPGRFGMLLGLPMGFFLVAVLRIFFIKSKKYFWVTLVVLILISLESLPSMKVIPFKLEKKGVYLSVQTLLPPGSPMLEFPITGESHFATLENILDQLQGSTFHWGNLAVGYGSKETETYKQLLHLDNLVRRNELSPDMLIRFARNLKIHYLLVHLDKYSYEVKQKWSNILNRSDGVELVKMIENSQFIKIREIH